MVVRPISICLENRTTKNQCRSAFFLASDRLRIMIDAHTTHGAHVMSDKILDLLEFIAAAAISAGFIVLAAYAVVGGI